MDSRMIAKASEVKIRTICYFFQTFDFPLRMSACKQSSHEAQYLTFFALPPFSKCSTRRTESNFQEYCLSLITNNKYNTKRIAAFRFLDNGCEYIIKLLQQSNKHFEYGVSGR